MVRIPKVNLNVHLHADDKAKLTQHGFTLGMTPGDWALSACLAMLALVEKDVEGANKLLRKFHQRRAKVHRAFTQPTEVPGVERH